MTNLQKMVVVKGRTVRHDGKDYGQDAVITLPAQDAGRLHEMGFVVTLASVRQALHDDADSEDGDDPNGDAVADDVKKSPGRPKGTK